MRFTPTGVPGVIEVAAEPRADPRGFFARVYCPEEFAAAGISFTSTQINLSRNDRMHTLRGMHWQDPPYAESKLVRVTRGAIHDVVIDLRRRARHFGVGSPDASTPIAPMRCSFPKAARTAFSPSNPTPMCSIRWAGRSWAVRRADCAMTIRALRSNGRPFPP